VTTRPTEIIDQHYYNSAQFFEQAATMFDSYDRSGPLVFVGEYSAIANAGGLPAGLLGNSIGEAAFMTGLERNSDVVLMSSYAPLYANYNHTQWNPDLIGYDQLSSFGSTSYWVQQLFARNVGDKVLPVTATAAGLYYSATADSRGGQVYLKIVNPGAEDVPAQIAFGGRSAQTASIEVLGDPDPQAGNTLASPDAVVPSHGTLRGSSGVFTYQVPANFPHRDAGGALGLAGVVGCQA
jgi:alpha-L-arabinofuranosidase